MLRISIAIATMALFVNASMACVSCKTDRGTAEKNSRCHGLIDSKNLKGPALKTEWHKCLENPDSYK